MTYGTAKSSLIYISVAKVSEERGKNRKMFKDLLDKTSSEYDEKCRPIDPRTSINPKQNNKKRKPDKSTPW